MKVIHLAVSICCVCACEALTDLRPSYHDQIDWSNVRPRHVQRANVVAQLTIGQQTKELEARITNGDIARPAQFPYQAGLLLHTQNGPFWCGGSVISDLWILTAGHCAFGLSIGVYVYLGALNYTDTTEKGRQIIFVSRRNVILHERYNGVNNDIALIKLPAKIRFNEFVRPVKLPKISSQYKSYADTTAIASGWGKTTDSANVISDVLRWIEVPVLSNAVCTKWYMGGIKPTNICVKTIGRKSTCSGDSGGPLVAAESKTLIGISSYVIGLGCEFGFPAVFTRVTEFLEWIAANSGVANR